MPEHLTINPSTLYFGTPVVLIVTNNPDGTPNITPMSSAWALGRSVVLGLGATGQGTANLQQSGECTLNFPSARLWQNVEAIAPTTGSIPVPHEKANMGYRYEADKFALGGFTQRQSAMVSPPCIQECPLQFEARLLARHESASKSNDRASSHLLFEVEIIRVHAHRDILIPETSHINTELWNPLHYVFRHYFGNAQDLGKNFRAR
ncbi:flavin reductase family protein [Novosphingobium terrae]|uniref:flavin reductase family protein n=1 Tax=Novosphingobium terrae TaxID=2726189 RepID=UPI00197F131A|nr:flavin reductase family protein [Novosphingobium terrae]